jgi:hypothetical protein
MTHKHTHTHTYTHTRCGWLFRPAGDGITDLEAVESTQGADLFIGYGGVVERKAVAAAAPWFVYSHDTLAEALRRRRVRVRTRVCMCVCTIVLACICSQPWHTSRGAEEA